MGKLQILNLHEEEIAMTEYIETSPTLDFSQGIPSKSQSDENQEEDLIISPFPACSSSSNIIEGASWLRKSNYISTQSLPSPFPASISSILKALILEELLPTSEFLKELKSEFLRSESCTQSVLCIYSQVFRILISNEFSLRIFIEDDYFMVFFRALEYEFPSAQYTHTLSEIQVHNILAISDPRFLHNMNLALRLSFLKNSPTFHLVERQETVNTLEREIWEAILCCYLESLSAQKRLMHMLKDHSPEAFHFVYELARLVYGVSEEITCKMYNHFRKKGILDALVEHLNYSQWGERECERLRSFLRELCSKMLAAKASILKKYLIRDARKKQTPLVLVLCNQALENVENLWELSKVIQSLVGQNTHTQYHKLGILIFEHFLTPAVKKIGKKDSQWTEEVLKIIIYCLEVSEHTKKFVIDNDIIEKVLKLLAVKDLALVAIQFLCCIARKGDPDFARILVSYGYLDHIFELWKAHSIKRDIIFSRIYSLVLVTEKSQNRKIIRDFVKKALNLPEKLAKLCGDVVKRCQDYLAESSSTFRKIKMINADFQNVMNFEQPCKKFKSYTPNN